MKSFDNPHTPVLLQEVFEIFAPIQEGLILDCTLGFGGHSNYILENKPKVNIIGIDRDEDARIFCQKYLEKYPDRFEILSGSFAEKFNEALNKGSLKGILADIGVSSLQLDNDERGFGFESSTLDMRMDQKQSIDAKTIINTYSQYDLERIFRDYGEIREYKKMASLIIDRRKKKPFISGYDLSSFLKKYFKNPRIHPATLAFQAIRIEINDELGQLNSLLSQSSSLRGVILCIITFHSLEDRIVKNAFKTWEKSCICPQEVYKCECGNNHSKGVIITKKPIIASENELRKNPRSRSAKLRAFRFKD